MPEEPLRDSGFSLGYLRDYFLKTAIILGKRFYYSTHTSKEIDDKWIDELEKQLEEHIKCIYLDKDDVEAMFSNDTTAVYCLFYGDGSEKVDCKFQIMSLDKTDHDKILECVKKL